MSAGFSTMGRIIAVANQPRAAFRFFNPVDAHINDGGAAFDPLALDDARFAHKGFRRDTTRATERDIAHLIFPDEVQTLPAAEDDKAGGPDGRLGDRLMLPLRIYNHADQPVKVGDFCRFGDRRGFVEDVGLRSTRIRRRDDTLVSVPNADFVQRELHNYARRRTRLYETTLGLRYETTPEQLRYVLVRLREMLNRHPKVSPEKLHVRFHGFGAYSLDIALFAYIRTRDRLTYRAIREDINLRIIDIINEAGTGFAFPSQTTYIGRDTGLDSERGREAERQVQEWRSAGQLPFPEFDESSREAQEDIRLSFVSCG